LGVGERQPSAPLSRVNTRFRFTHGLAPTGSRRPSGERARESVYRDFTRRWVERVRFVDTRS